MCLPSPKIPNPAPPAPPAPPGQSAGQIQSSAFNQQISQNNSTSAMRSGVSALTIPLLAKPSIGGTGGGVGLNIPAA